MSCSKVLHSVGEVTDHVATTVDDELVGDVFNRPSNEELMSDPKKMEQFDSAVAGYSHRRFKDARGKEVPPIECNELRVLLYAGTQRCTSCEARFPHNNYRYSQHLINENHGAQDEITMAIKDLKEIEELVEKWL